MKVRFMFWNGEELMLDRRAILPLMTSKYLAPYYAISIIYLLAVEPYPFLSGLQLRVSLLVNISIIATTLLIFLGYSHFYISILQSRNIIPRPNVSILFLLANATMVSLLVIIFQFGFGQKLSNGNIVVILLNNLVITEIILLIFSIYTLPLIEIRTANNNYSERETSPEVIIYGKSVNPDTIMYIKSDDAYIYIKTTNVPLHVRGNVIDVAKILIRNGIITHRSFWINPKHALSMDMEGSVIRYINMKDNTKIPVAKARSALVAQVFSEYPVTSNKI